jgi:hypothetical protein
MTNPPNRPRDDRRMHEGEKPGLPKQKNRGDQETIELDHEERERSSTADRHQESVLGGEVATRSGA